MQAILENTLNGVTLADPQHHRHMTVYPVEFSGSPKLEYEMLRKALLEGWIRITEVSEGGSVPDLKVLNESSFNILLLDGEELSGAKQNRVLNTTLLISGKSELIIPVSCTEHGRWSLISNEFHDSEKMMFSRGRGKKMKRVHESLRSGAGHRSDQGEVWDDIAVLQDSMQVNSPTSAMRDVFNDKKASLDDYLGAFPKRDTQCGMLVGLNGKVAGFEFLSRSTRFSTVHKQLLESYAMDALADRLSEDSVELPLNQAQQFLEQIWSTPTEAFPAAAMGSDVRLESSKLVGAGLVESNELIHFSAFSQEQEIREHRPPRMASYRRRRYNRG